MAGWIRRLDRTLFIDGKHNSVLGWIQIQAYKVFELFLKIRVVADLELLNQMRLESTVLPNSGNKYMIGAPRCGSDA